MTPRLLNNTGGVLLNAAPQYHIKLLARSKTSKLAGNLAKQIKASQ